MNSSIIYIYVLKEPSTGAIRYLGKTCNTVRRLREHIGHARSSKRKHYWRDHWIKSILDRKEFPVFEVVEQCAKDRWAERERHWIARLKADGCRLTNLTAGGEGIDKDRTPDWTAKIVAANTGRKNSAETCELIREIMIQRSNEIGCKNGHPWTEENTRYDSKNGRTYRVCKICSNARAFVKRRERGLIKGRKRDKCRRGHLMAGDNLRLMIRYNKDGSFWKEERICKTCVTIRNKRCVEQQKETANHERDDQNLDRRAA